MPAIPAEIFEELEKLRVFTEALCGADPRFVNRKNAPAPKPRYSLRQLQ
jgi:hypothetical protein